MVGLVRARVFAPKERMKDRVAATKRSTLNYRTERTQPATADKANKCLDTQPIICARNCRAPRSIYLSFRIVTELHCSITSEHCVAVRPPLDLAAAVLVCSFRRPELVSRKTIKSRCLCGLCAPVESVCEGGFRRCQCECLPHKWQFGVVNEPATFELELHISVMPLE